MVTHAKDKPIRSLAAQSRRQFLIIAAVIFVAFVALLTSFTIYEIDAAANGFMRLEARRLEIAISENPNYELPREENFSAYRRWEDIPLAARSLFSEQRIEPVSPLDIEHFSQLGERQYAFMLYSSTRVVGGLYLLGFENADAFDETIRAIVKRTLLDSILVGLLVFLMLISALAWLFQRALEPLQLLVDWSKRMKADPEQAMAVDFSVSEVNEIAADLLSSMDKLKAYNEREQQFLKHASHELRTPLATIQASLDTLAHRTSEGDANYPAVQRATRASGNMIQLSETLLWLARESKQSVRRGVTSPQKMCEEITSDLAYLIEDRDVCFSITATIKSLDLEVDFYRIVLTNIIRNAFQYSADGNIELVLSESAITVSNPIDRHSPSESVSFGLGLQLVERIAYKLGWSFEFRIDTHSAVAKITW